MSKVYCLLFTKCLVCLGRRVRDFNISKQKQYLLIHCSGEKATNQACWNECFTTIFSQMSALEMRSLALADEESQTLNA